VAETLVNQGDYSVRPHRKLVLDMSYRLRIVIKESAEALEKHLKDARTASQKERVQML
jgi:hypothetical protein